MTAPTQKRMAVVRVKNAEPERTTLTHDRHDPNQSQNSPANRSGPYSEHSRLRWRTDSLAPAHFIDLLHYQLGPLDARRDQLVGAWTSFRPAIGLLTTPSAVDLPRTYAGRTCPAGTLPSRQCRPDSQWERRT